MPGVLNKGADMLSRSNVPSDEWMLHPQNVQEIWEIFCKAEVDLFASIDSLTAKLIFLRARMLWPTNGPTIYTLLPQSL